MPEATTVLLPNRAVRQSAQRTLSDIARKRMIECEHGGVVRADWLDMVFLHFEVEPEALQLHTPFELDLFDGRAFVSLVAFVMRWFRIRGTGPVGSWLCAPVARHGFLNVRTYVRHRGEPGIHFLTEWVSNPLSVVFGPRTYGLPYRWGRLQYQHDPSKGEIRGTVSTPDRSAALSYRADIEQINADRLSPGGSLEEFLLERYIAFTHRKGVNREFRIWHEPWRIQSIDVQIDDRSLLGLTGSWLRDARIVSAQASPGVRDVWIGRPRRVS